MTTKKQILKYIFSLLLIALTQLSHAQHENKRQFYIRPGVDLSRFALNLFQDSEHSAWELNLDSEIKYRFFPVIEFGQDNIKSMSETYSYQSKGNYYRFGMNYNMLNYRQRFDRNIFFIGFRLALSNFTQSAPEINFSNNWGDFQTAFDPVNVSFNWFEGVIGLRGEIIKNVYLGYTVRIKQALNHDDFGNFTPYWIPGFGKGAKNRTVGMSYSISYAIPIINPKPDFKENKNDRR